MIQRIAGLLGLMLLSSVAMAQDYGLSVGFHQTTASVNTSESGSLQGTTGSTGGLLGYDLGFVAAFDLVPDLKFRTGVLYDSRPFQYKMSGGNVNFNFAYIDVPVNLQYNFNPTFGVFGGVVVGINTSSSVSAPGGMTVNANAKSLYPLVDAGFNFTFDNMIGFDLFYEYGLGDFADNVKNYSTFGLRFMYWL